MHNNIIIIYLASKFYLSDSGKYIYNRILQLHLHASGISVLKVYRYIKLIMDVVRI